MYTAWKLTTHWILVQTPVSLISAKNMTISFTMTGIGQWWFWFITIKSVMTKVLPCLDLTCRLRFQMTTEPFVAAEASMCSKNNKIIQFTKATKNRKVALRLKKQKQKPLCNKDSMGCMTCALKYLFPALKVLNLLFFFIIKKYKWHKTKILFFFLNHWNWKMNRLDFVVLFLSLSCK